MGSLSHTVVAALYLQQRDVPATYILKREKGDAFSRFRFVLEKLWRDPREMCNKDPCWQSIQAPANADPLGNWIDIIKTVVGWTIFFFWHFGQKNPRDERNGKTVLGQFSVHGERRGASNATSFA